MTNTVSSAEIVKLIATLDWAEFDESDFETFGGVESQHPMIAYDGNVTYVLEGNCLAVYGTDDVEGVVQTSNHLFFLDAKTY